MSIYSKRYQPYLLLLPALLLSSLIFIFPIVYIIYLSTTDYNLMSPNPARFVKLDNFVEMMRDSLFWLSLKNSILFTICTVVVSLLLAIPVALLLNSQILKRFRLSGFLRGIVLVPWVMPMVVAIIVWKWLYDGSHGVFSHYLVEWGLVSEPIAFLSSPEFVWPAVILVAVWKEFPYMTVALLAGLQTIPRDFYEAAEIDGASKWRQFVHLTMPMLQPILLVVSLLGTIAVFNNFVMIHLLTAGGPGYTTQVLPTYVYFQSFDRYDMGYAASISIFMVLLLFIVGTLYLRIYEEKSK